MNLDRLKARSQGVCELCKNDKDLISYQVAPKDEYIIICEKCDQNLPDPNKNPNHFQCLNESIWSEIPAVQVVAYRTLLKLKHEDFASNLLDIVYLDDEIKNWAEDGLKSDKVSQTKDSNGVILNSGDSVSIIKDLDVKGAGFTAKRGTTVKNITLTDNKDQIEGRVNGVKIVLLSKFLKKQ